MEKFNFYDTLYLRVCCPFERGITENSSQQDIRIFSYFYIVRPISITCLFILLSLSVNTYGQGENNIWCFGTTGGLNFNNNPPTSYVSNLNGWEGPSSVCNAAGNLLFYCNGDKVYDRNNNQMPNGSGLTGNYSTTQGTAIIQSYTNGNQYFLFTMQNYGQPPYYLSYSIIDMTLNAGFGDVVAAQKNIVIDSSVGEKMVVAKGNCATWLIVHHRSQPDFHAFKVDWNGINVNSVISTSGASTNYTVGEMKMSTNNNNIAVANDVSPNDLGLHSFDQATGIVSNYIHLDSIDAYGVNYSPDDSKLYVGSISNNPVYQYDLSLLPNVAAVLASKTGVTTGSGFGLRTGPNNKVYFVSGNTISVFNDPNLPGPACNPTYNITQALTAWTLGNQFVVNSGNGNGNTFSSHDTTACLQDTLALSAPAGYNTYLWSDGKTTQTDSFTSAGTWWVISTNTCGVATDTFHVHAAPVSNTTASTDTTICFVNNVPVFSAITGYTTYTWSDGKTTQTDTMSTAGTKWVVAKNSSCDIHTDTFHVHAAPIITTTFVKDTNVCFVNNIPIVSAPAGYTTYLWSDGKVTQQDTFGNAGTKWVRSQTNCNTRIDTFKLHDWRDTTIASIDTIHCVAYSPITIYAPGGYTSYAWSDGITTQVDTFFSTTTKWVVALNGCNMLIDTVHFTATTVPQDSVSMNGTDTTVCFEAGPFSIIAPTGFTYYLWNDGSTQQANTFAAAGIKWVYSQRLCYMQIDTFNVTAQTTDTTTNRIDTMLCFSQLATLSATPGYDTYLWSDGNTGINDTFTHTSVKIVNAHKACTEKIDTFHVQFINDLNVDLGPDTAICKGETVRLDATSAYNIATYLWQDGHTNAIYNAGDNGDYTVKVSVGPCNVSDTVRVHMKTIDVKLGKGLIPCNEEAITLDAGVDSASYLWQDGSTQRTYRAAKEGLYTVKVTQGLCTVSASVNVKNEGCPCNVVLPTAFSPNNDNKNDRFGISVSCTLNSYKLMIYNRWGNRIFYTENINEKWDGTCKGVALDGDVFNYYLEFKDAENKSYYYKGDITLIR